MAPRQPFGAPRSQPAAGDRAHGLGPELRALVQTYVSYLSGCDACAIEALRLARAADGDPARLDLLSTWRRASSRTYTDRERIALVWAEVVAVSGEEGIGTPLLDQSSEVFSPAELDALTRSVVTTRGYQRLTRERSGSVTAPGGRGAGQADPYGSRASCDICAAN